MADPIGGGIGGPGGIKPGGGMGGPSDISKLGKAPSEDVEKFKDALSSSDVQQTQQTQQAAGGPFDVQKTQAPEATGKGGPSLGDELVKKGMDFLKVAKGQDQKLKADIAQAAEKGFSPTDTIRFQHEAGNIFITTTVIKGGVDSMKKTFETMVRGQ